MEIELSAESWPRGLRIPAIPPLTACYFEIRDAGR